MKELRGKAASSMVAEDAECRPKGRGDEQAAELHAASIVEVNP